MKKTNVFSTIRILLVPVSTELHCNILRFICHRRNCYVRFHLIHIRLLFCDSAKLCEKIKNIEDRRLIAFDNAFSGIFISIRICIWDLKENHLIRNFEWMWLAHCLCLSVHRLCYCMWLLWMYIEIPSHTFKCVSVLSSIFCLNLNYQQQKIERSYKFLRVSFSVAIWLEKSCFAWMCCCVWCVCWFPGERFNSYLAD